MMLRMYFIALFLIFVIYPFKGEKAKSENGKVSVTTYPSEFGGYGYNILVDQKCIVHQPHIPAISKTVGFPTRESAQMVADLVVKRMKSNQMPPAVTLDDLRKLQLVN